MPTWGLTISLARNLRSRAIAIQNLKGYQFTFPRGNAAKLRWLKAISSAINLANHAKVRQRNFSRWTTTSTLVT